jgi:predicted nuclease of predicted toxin-antitoxin system
MKLLLDECVPRRLKRDFPQHEVSTVIEAGFQGLKNGHLLKSAASAGFEVLITVDQNLTYQQNLLALPLAVIVLVVQHNKYELLALLVPQALAALQSIHVGEVVRI